MPSVIELTDQSELVPTDKFPHLKIEHDTFNPVQSRFFEVYDSDANVIVASSTSSGKTVIAEMAIAHEVFKRGGKGLYLGPLKSLSGEKINDWAEEDHGFSQLKRCICTGDFRLTPNRIKEVSESQIILMTNEMLNSKSRNFKAEKNDWLAEIGTIVTDEVHEIGSENRGDKLEVALMKMSSINPKIRHICLSATIPNSDQLAGWLCKLTDRDTYVIKSHFRQCKLNTHYVMYDDSCWKYESKERQKIDTALSIYRKHSNDKFIFFVHSKDMGRNLVNAFHKMGIYTDFHNGDLDAKKRHMLEDKFRTDPQFKVLVATPTLAAGVNTPARRVVILGVHRGLDVVSGHSIRQQAGRAGRPKYDKEGDAYILLPQSEFKEHKERIETLLPVQSQLMPYGSDDHRILAFHVINEIAVGNIEDVQGIYDWYGRTFASYQRQNLDEEIVQEMVEKLSKRRLITVEDNGRIVITPTGKVASAFYYSPYDVADWKVNFSNLFESGKEFDEVWIAASLAKVDSHRVGIVNSAESQQVADFVNRVGQKVFANIGKLSQHQMKMCYCYYCLLNGFNDPVLIGPLRGLKNDIERQAEVLQSLDGLCANWNKATYFKKLRQKLSHGVLWELLDLCDVPDIGKSRATKLYQSGIKTALDILERPKLVRVALSCSEKMCDKLVNNAKSYLEQVVANG